HPSSLYLLYLLNSSPLPPALPSFPTRRSSDLSEIHWVATRASPPVTKKACASVWVDFATMTEVARTSMVRESLSIAARATSPPRDRKSTRLNSSHLGISYAVFCLKKKKKKKNH